MLRFVIVSSFLFLSLTGISQGVVLSTKTDSVLIGDGVELLIEFSGLECVLEPIQITDISLSNELPFKKKVIFVPKELGLNTIGPYRIKIGGQEYVSNSLKVKVVKVYGVPETLRVTAPEKVKVNEPFKIVVSSNKNDLSKLNFVNHRVIVLKATKRTVNKNSIDGVETTSTIVTFDLVIRLKGEHIIKDEFFSNLSNHCTVEPIVVEAK